MDEVRLGVERFCLLAGVEALAEMMDDDARAICDAVKPCWQACEIAKSRAHDIWNQLQTDFQGGQPMSVSLQRDFIFVHPT